MGQFLEVVKNFFGLSSTQVSKETALVLQPESLLPYAKEMSFLLHFQEIGTELEQVLSGIEVQKQSIFELLQRGEDFCDAWKVRLDALGQYSQYPKLIHEMLSLPAPDASADQDSLSNGKVTFTLQSLIKHYNILETLGSKVPCSEQVSQKLQDISDALGQNINDYHSILPVFTAFKQKEAVLSAEIPSIREPIATYRNQNPFSTDDDGHAELIKQREALRKEEETLHKMIANLMQSLSETHASFAALLQMELSELSETEDTLRSLKQEVDAFLRIRNSILKVLSGEEHKFP